MKKIKFNYRSWKTKKRQSFKFYFVLFSMIVIASAISIGSAFNEVLNLLLSEDIEIPNYLITFTVSLIVGLILAFFIGKSLINPIKELKDLMNEVANGNLNIRANEKSIFDEIEDMKHYFNLMMKELSATETIQSDFISNVSHEFKTPLNAIDGYATLLSDDNITEIERKEYIEKIHFNARRMNELIQNILLLSKIDNQAINFKKNEYSLDEQIRQSILFLEPKWMEKNVEFDVDLDEVKFTGSESLMMHVWNNLIDNAIKFGPKSAIIKITLKNIGDEIIFTIEDEGPGIKGESIDFIFNKFYQIDTSHKSEGNGLGLSLVKKIIDIHEGSINVENLQDKGCKFTVKLK